MSYDREEFAGNILHLRFLLEINSFEKSQQMVDESRFMPSVILELRS